MRDNRSRDISDFDAYPIGVICFIWGHVNHRIRIARTEVTVQGIVENVTFGNSRCQILSRGYYCTCKAGKKQK